MRETDARGKVCGGVCARKCQHRHLHRHAQTARGTNVKVLTVNLVVTVGKKVILVRKNVESEKVSKKVEKVVPVSKICFKK